MNNRALLLLLILLLNQNAIAIDSEIPPSQIQEIKKESTSKKPTRRPSIKAIAIGVEKALVAIKNDPFSENSIWDIEYLNRDHEVSDLLKKFVADEYATKAKKLNFDGMSKDQIIKKILSEGFIKKDPEAKVDQLLGRAKDREVQDSGDIYIASDGSMIILKEESKYRHNRPQAYIVKAALKNPTGPSTWQNEAFKITKDGFPVPKGPKQSHGLKIHAPNTSGQDEDKGWIDLIMEEVHSDIDGKK